MTPSTLARPAAPRLRRAAPAATPEADARLLPRLWDALRDVLDPEIPVSLVDLGLIYAIRLDGATAHVELTYTATACPCTHFIQWDIAERLLQEAGVEDVCIHEVWSPAWTKARITPAGRARLKQLGIAM